MAGKNATLAIRIVSDASKASAGFDAAESRVAGFQRGLDRASVAAGGVLAGVGALAKEAYDAASSLQQSSGAVETVFGAQAAAVKAYAADAAQANGLASSAYQESAALIGSQLKSLGFPLEQAADQTDGLIDRASDLAATFGGSTEDAVAALSSALKGERDPIERYGISLSQAAIDAKVASLGLDTSTDASKRNADAQAALALVAEQSASAQGAFSREADTAAGQSARAAAEFENASAALGEVLLPIVTEAARKLSELATWLVANKDVVVPLVGVVAGLAGGILALNGAMRAYSMVQTIVNAVINASPLMRLVMIITAIVAIVVLMYQKFDWFRSLVDGVGGALKAAFDGAKAAVSWVIDKIKWLLDKAGAVGNFIGGLFGGPSMTVAVAPDAGGGGALAGVYGAAAGGPAPGPIYGAPMTALSGGGSTAGQGSGTGPTTVIHLTVNGAVDPTSTGRQLVKILKDYGVATGGQVVVSLGGRT